MSVHDYLIDHIGFDWAHLLSGWERLLPTEFTVWLMNRFGDLFLILPDGSVSMLDIGAGSLTKLAESRDEFSRKIDEGDNAEDWLMIPLVDRLVAAGIWVHMPTARPFGLSDCSLLRASLLPFRMGGFKVALMGLRPGTERSDWLQERPAQRRQAVVHPRRHFGVDLALQQAVPLQRPERLRQHLLRHVRQMPP